MKSRIRATASRTDHATLTPDARADTAGIRHDAFAMAVILETVTTATYSKTMIATIATSMLIASELLDASQGVSVDMAIKGTGTIVKEPDALGPDALRMEQSVTHKDRSQKAIR